MQYSKDKVDIKILKRFVEGNVSEAEELIVRQWFEDDHLRKQLSSSSFDIWEQISSDIEVKDLDGLRILDHIHHEIKREEATFMKDSDKLPVFLERLSRVAAILLLPVLLTTFLLYHKLSSISGDSSYSEIYAPVGTRTTFYLPDGSSGWLNGGSSLKFPARFQNKTRNVELVGEVYLNVAENTRKPFIVSTSDIQVEVYGTAFNIMAYPDEYKTEVTLESGSVEVFKKRSKKPEHIAKLLPEQSLIYYHINDSASLVPVRSADKTAWKDGMLVFRYEPLSEVINKINRWYNVKIQIADPELTDHIYYGTFRNETFEEVLKLLQFTAPIHYKDIGRDKKPDGTYEIRIVELYSREN